MDTNKFGIPLFLFSMIKVIFSKLITTPYTNQELEKMDFDNRTFVVSHNFEKTIREEQIETSDFFDISEIRKKILNLYTIHDSKPTILVMPNYSLNSAYLIEKEFHHNDINAIFESMLFKYENDKIIEIVRVIGKNLDNVLRAISEYSSLHKLAGKLQMKTNLIRSDKKMTYLYGKKE